MVLARRLGARRPALARRRRSSIERNRRSKRKIARSARRCAQPSRVSRSHGPSRNCGRNRQLCQIRYRFQLIFPCRLRVKSSSSSKCRFYRLARSSLLRAARKKSSKPATLVSVYFDTDKLKLRNKGLSLRVRRIGRRHIQTIKRESGEGAALFTRDEWEHQIGGGQPDLDVAQDGGHVFGKKVRRGLKPIFETRVRRTVYPI